MSLIRGQCNFKYADDWNAAHYDIRYINRLWKIAKKVTKNEGFISEHDKNTVDELDHCSNNVIISIIRYINDLHDCKSRYKIPSFSVTFTTKSMSAKYRDLIDDEYSLDVPEWDSCEDNCSDQYDNNYDHAYAKQKKKKKNKTHTSIGTLVRNEVNKLSKIEDELYLPYKLEVLQEIRNMLLGLEGRGYICMIIASYVGDVVIEKAILEDSK